MAEASIVMPLDFLRVPLIAAIGAAFYQEPIDIWVFVGAGIIVTGIVIGLLPAGQQRGRIGDAASAEAGRRDALPGA